MEQISASLEDIQSGNVHQDKTRLEDKDFKPVNISDVGEHIQELLKLLADGDFSVRPRRSYMDELTQCVQTYFGYNEFLTEKLLHLFSPVEAIKYIEAQEQARPLSLRTNTLKTKRRDLAQALINRNVDVDPIGDWSKVGLVVKNTGKSSTDSLSSTSEYLSGRYMLQTASSFTAVMALDPKENETILDLCCAPGGKTSYISALMKNTGVVVANDSSKERLKAHVANLHRLGVDNCITTCLDGRIMSGLYKNYFDRCLLDAPCTGSGVISSHPSIKISKSVEDIRRCEHIQKELILAACDCVDADGKAGGVFVYSTCSVFVEENEGVVDYLLKNRHCRVLDIEENDCLLHRAGQREALHDAALAQFFPLQA